MHRETCEATHVYHEQSERILDARMVCLDGSRAELRALARLFAQADATIVGEADKAVAHLGDLGMCADREELSTLTAPPTDLEKLRIVDEARAVAEAQLLRYHTRQAIDLDALESALSAARKVGYPPLEARLLYALGLTEGMLGTDVGAGLTHLEEALVAAVSGGDRVAQTRISAALAQILTRQLGEPDRARFWGDFARASLAALGSGYDDVEYEVAQSLARLAWDTGDLAESEREFKQALAAAERARDLAANAKVGLDTDRPLYRRFEERVNTWLRDRRDPNG